MTHLVGGALGGLGLAAGEAFVNYVSGGALPWRALATLTAGYAFLGALYGAMLGLCTRRWRGEERVQRAAIVAAAVFGYGLLRLYHPGGWLGESAYLALCIGLFALLRMLSLCDVSPPGWSGTAQCVTIALAAIIGGS